MESLSIINLKVYTGNSGLITVDIMIKGEVIITFPTDVNILELAGHTENFYKEVRKFLYMSTESGTANYLTSGNALQWLHNRGAIYMRNVFGSERYLIKDFLKEKFPIWNRSLHSDDNDIIRPPVIMVSGEGSIQIPFELLPFFDFEWNETINNIDSLFNAASKFLGFSTVVCRELYHFKNKNQESLCDGIIDNTQGMRVRFFKDINLANALNEEQFLKENVNINLIDPWPAQGFVDEQSFLNEFTDNLLYGAETFGGQLDHIQHLACHADTELEDSQDYTFSVTYPQQTFTEPEDVTVDVSFEDLQTGMSGNFQKDKSISYPLIFLNACGSSRINPLSSSSYPKFFYQNRNRGFIGAELAIPDGLASQFAAYFYQYFDSADAVSLAIYKARRKLLKFHNSPLGILYTVYANPMLKVHKPLGKIADTNNVSPAILQIKNQTDQQANKAID